jgi:hypothetical protein
MIENDTYTFTGTRARQRFTGRYIREIQDAISIRVKVIKIVHRKKETNTLYTINALNDLIKKLNGGVVDPSYRVNWQHYKNCILLTNHIELKQFNTKVYKIVEL